MKKILLATLMTLSVGAASANTLYDSNLMQTPFNTTGFLDKFNPNLGPLLGIQIIYDAYMNQSISASRHKDSGSILLDSVMGHLSLNFSTGLMIPPTTNIQLNGASFPTGTYLSFGDISTATANFNAVDVIYNVLPADFNAFKGPGNFSVTCTGAASVTPNFGDATFSQSTQGACKAEVRYAYGEIPIEVPEPFSLSLLALGLIGLAAVRRGAVKK